MQKIFLLLLAIAFFSCQNSSNQKQPPVYTDTPTPPKTTENDPDQRKHDVDEQDRLDSLLLLRMLDHALTYANDHKQQHSFRHAFTMAASDSGQLRTTQLIFGNLFDRHKKHLFVRREAWGGAICTIYLLQNEQFKNVCEHEQPGVTYVDDSIRDINGDQYSDFAVHWYAAAGCCPRNAYYVYLYKPETGGFTEYYEFINPTFSPKEKLIRGFEYGHPADIGLYKYRWRNLTVDTIEYIYPDLNKPGTFIKTKYNAYRPLAKDGIVLKALPDEYKRIEGVSWFSEF